MSQLGPQRKTPEHAPREWIDDPERTARERRMPYVLEEIKNDLKDMREDIRENRSFFQQRMDKLDGRIWAIVITLISSLFGIVAALASQFLGAG